MERAAERKAQHVRPTPAKRGKVIWYQFLVEEWIRHVKKEERLEGGRQTERDEGFFFDSASEFLPPVFVVEVAIGIVS